MVEVLRVAAHMNDRDAIAVASHIHKPIGTKQLLMVAEMAKQGSENNNNCVDVNVFLECLRTVGLWRKGT